MGIGGSGEAVQRCRTAVKGSQLLVLQFSGLKLLHALPLAFLPCSDPQRARVHGKVGGGAASGVAQQRGPVRR